MNEAVSCWVPGVSAEIRKHLQQHRAAVSRNQLGQITNSLVRLPKSKNRWTVELVAKEWWAFLYWTGSSRLWTWRLLQFRFFPWAGIGLSASRVISAVVGIMYSNVGIATLRGEAPQGSLF